MGCLRSNRIWFLGIWTLLILVGCQSHPAVDSSPLTVPQIVAMSREGVPAEEIIGRIQHSRVIYRLLPNQVEYLRRKGVSDQVLAFIQNSYRSALQRYPELRDWDSWSLYEGYWYASPGDGGAASWFEEE